MSPAIGISLAAALCCLAAASFASWLGDRIRPAAEVFASASAGAVLIVALFHIVPEAAHLDGNTPLFVAAGLAASAALHRVCDRAGGRVGGDLFLLLGIGVHSVADGAILAVAASAGGVFLASSAPAMVLHEFPEAVLCYVLARRAALPPRPAWALAVFAAGGTTVIGTVLSEPLVQTVDAGPLGALLGLSAGVLIFSGGSILLARPARRPVRRGLAASLAALAAGAFVVNAPDHDHSAHAHEPLHDHAHDDSAAANARAGARARGVRPEEAFAARPGVPWVRAED